MTQDTWINVAYSQKNDIYWKTLSLKKKKGYCGTYPVMLTKWTKKQNADGKWNKIYSTKQVKLINKYLLEIKDRRLSKKGCWDNRRHCILSQQYSGSKQMRERKSLEKKQIIISRHKNWHHFKQQTWTIDDTEKFIKMK